MKRKRLFFLVIISIFVAWATKRFYFSPHIPFAYDEPDYVANSILLFEFNFGINTNPVVWSQRWAYDQPHLYHYLTALFLEYKYQQPINSVVEQNQLNQRYGVGSPRVVFGKTGDGKIITDPEIADYKKAYQVILVAREISFYFYLVGGIILISIVYFASHPILGALISIFYLNDYFYNISVLAQADGLLILLILINIFLSLAYIKIPKHRLIIAVLLGISCGLAISTKLNGGLIFISSIVCVLIACLYKPKTDKSANLAYIVLILVLGFGVFYWLNPYFYSDPFQNIYNMFQYRIDLGESFKIMATNETLPNELLNKIVVIFQNLYQQTGQTQTFSLIVSTLSTALSFILLFLIFVKKIIVKPIVMFLLISSTLSFFLILVHIPMNWSRYYYPAIIFNMLMIFFIIEIVFNSSKYQK